MSSVVSLAAVPLAAILAFGGSGASANHSAEALLVVGSSTPVMAKASLDSVKQAPRIVPMHTKKQCDKEMEKGAKFCKKLRPAKAAALCHAANMTRYAGCLLGASG